MSKQDDIFESLMLGGILGAALGALVSKNSKGENSVLGAIAGAAILASIKANNDAVKTDIPLILEENNILYKVYPDGTKEFIKNIPKSSQRFRKKFTLE